MAVRVTSTPAVWDLASVTAAKLRLNGMNFPALDVLIAATACGEKLPLLARDAHFPMIRDHALPALRIIPLTSG